MADEFAGKCPLDLAKEQEDMITIQQLAKDGGQDERGCSISDAAKRKMEVVWALQEEMKAGCLTQDDFKNFNDE